MNVAIIKYNAGNIYSVSYALKRLGVEAIVTADPEQLRKADKVIFPGVGEARTTMDYLRAHQLDVLIKEFEATALGDLSWYAVDVPSFGRGRCGLSGDF